MTAVRKQTVAGQEAWPKKIEKIEAKKGQKLVPTDAPSYDDEVTTKHIKAMNEKISDADFVGYTIIDGPAW